MFERLTRPDLKRGAVITLFGASLAVSAAAAQTPPPLNTEPHINASLTAAAVGEILIRKCDTIKPRYLVVFSKVKGLESYARNLGYTEEQVEAFLDDNTEQKRVRRAANAYLEAQGAVKGDKESYCTAGRKEIEKGTLTGQMLWSSD